MTDQLPPCDIEAERAVISAALLSPDALGVVRDTLTPDAFFDLTCRIVATAAFRLYDNGTALDIVTLATSLKSTGDWETIGGAPVLAGLFESSPDVSNIADHCKLVLDKHRLRRLLDVCRRHAVQCRGDVGDVGEYCSTVEREIMQAVDLGLTQDSPQTIRELVEQETKVIQERFDKPVTNCNAIKTGVYELDVACSGGLDDALYVFAGRPGMGKTAVALSILKNVAARKDSNRRASMLFSLEMPKGQLTQRVLANESSVAINKLKGQRLDATEWRRVLAAKESLSKLPISLHYRPGAHVTAVRSAVRREFAKHKRESGVEPGIVIIDYLNLLSGNRTSKSNREEEVSSITRYLMQLPTEFKCPVILLAQLNRELEKRPNKRPQLSDLRESGAVEQDAYGIMFLYRDEYYHPETDDKDILEVIIAKARNDSTGTVRCRFNGPFMRVESENQELHDSICDIDGAILGGIDVV